MHAFSYGCKRNGHSATGQYGLHDEKVHQKYLSAYEPYTYCCYDYYYDYYYDYDYKGQKSLYIYYMQLTTSINSELKEREELNSCKWFVANLTRMTQCPLELSESVGMHAIQDEEVKHKDMTFSCRSICPSRNHMCGIILLQCRTAFSTLHDWPADRMAVRSI